MGYLYMLSAVVSNAFKGFCGKKQSLLINGPRDAMTVNFFRMVCCAIVGAGILAAGNSSFIPSSGAALPILIVSGFSNASQVVCWMLAARLSAVTLMDVFATLGLIVPMVTCSFLFGETIRPIQWLGYLLLCAAAAVMCSYSVSLKKKKMGFADFALLLGFGFSLGITDLTQKLYVNYCPGLPTSMFNFYTFLFAAVFTGIATLITPKKAGEPPCPIKKAWPYVVAMALSLFLVTWCKTAAAAVLPAAQAYPLYQGGVLISMALVGAVFFGEKITRRCILGMSMTFMAMLMMNVL